MITNLHHTVKHMLGLLLNIWRFNIIYHFTILFLNCQFLIVYSCIYLMIWFGKTPFCIQYWVSKYLENKDLEAKNTKLSSSYYIKCILIIFILFLPKSLMWLLSWDSSFLSIITILDPLTAVMTQNVDLISVSDGYPPSRESQINALWQISY